MSGAEDPEQPVAAAEEATEPKEEVPEPADVKEEPAEEEAPPAEEQAPPAVEEAPAASEPVKEEEQPEEVKAEPAEEQADGAKEAPPAEMEADVVAGTKRKLEDEEEQPPRKKTLFSNGPDPADVKQEETAAPADGAEAPAEDADAAAAATTLQQQPATSPTAAITPVAGEDYIEIPTAMVGKLIGKGGETIRQLQYTTQTRVQIDHTSQGETKKVFVTSSSREAVEAAKKEILTLVSTDDARGGGGGGDHSQEVDCPQGIVGRIIGRGGETIRALQQASQANIVVNQNFPEGHPRKVIVTGRTDAVERAVKMVTELINGEPGSANAIIQKYGAGITRTVDCPRSMVGRVIGKGGETIKTLQKQFGANIQIDQSMDPMKITIAGQPQAVSAAQAAVEEIVAGGNPFPSVGGGYGGGGQGYGAPYGGQQYAAAAPAFGGYGGFPAATPAYGYGGYGGYGGGYGAAAGGGYGGGYGAADPYGAAAAGGYGAGGYGAQSGGGGGGSAWQEQQDGEGRTYYYNTITGVSQWEKPADM